MNKYGEVLENVDLKNYNSYGIGGISKYLVKPFNSEMLVELVNFLNEENIKYFIIGNGTNVILPDEDFDGVIIKLDKLNKISVENDSVYVEAGVNLGYLVNELLKFGITNLTFLSGVPGTIGGALVQNAGCYGKEIFDYIEEITFWNGKTLETKNRDEISYSYRYTEFKDNTNIIISCKLKGLKGNVDEAIAERNKNIQKRKDTQPLEFKNAGSVFRNPTLAPVGKLIEDAGLKGKNFGGAKVSEKHANFIINFKNATSNDIINLIEFIKEEIKRIYDVELELEQEIVKW